jgi:autotransporter-associated beta strand protein
MKNPPPLPARRPSTSSHKTSTLRNRSARLLPLTLLVGAALLIGPRNHAAVYNWSGAGSTGNWNESANWGYAGVPNNGDTLIFPARQPGQANTNNIPNLSVSQIRFVGAGGGYALWGNSFTLTNSIEATNTAGANTINNAITLGASPVMVNVGSATSLTLAGALGGTGGLAKNGAGTLTCSGETANTYSGTTLVNEGTLVLQKTTNLKSVPGNLVVGDGSGSGVVMLGSNNQIANPADVFIQTGGLLECAGFYALVNTLHGSGTVNFGAGGSLTIGSSNGTSTFDGSMTGIGYAAGDTLRKMGSGTFTLNGNGTYSAGTTHVSSGKLVVNGSIGRPVTVDNGAGAMLGGNGTVGNITCNGTVSPGASPGKLSALNVTFSSTGRFFIELQGNTVGSGYDQLHTIGTVNLNTGATLSAPTVGFLPTDGDQFIIISNSIRAVIGTFDGLAEGAVVSDNTGKFKFRLSYAGGAATTWR